MNSDILLVTVTIADSLVAENYSWFTDIFVSCGLSQCRIFGLLESANWWWIQKSFSFKFFYLLNWKFYTKYLYFCKSVKMSRRLRPFLKSLLNEVPSNTLIASISQVPQVFKYLNLLRGSKFLKCTSTRVSFKFPSASSA